MCEQITPYIVFKFCRMSNCRYTLYMTIFLSVVRNLFVISFGLTGAYFLTTFLSLSDETHIFLSQIYVSALALVVAFGVAEIINKLIHIALHSRFKESKESLKTALPFINNLLRAVILLGVLLYILQTFNVDITPALASAGFVGVALAFAAKDFMANLFGGISIFFDKPYVVGDYVIIADKHRGEVVEIGMRSTKIKTRDDILLTVPNSVMTTNAVINETGFEPMLRLRIPILIDYMEDLERIENILVELSHQHSEILKHPSPRVRYRAFDDSGIKLELLIVIEKPAEKGRIVHEIIKLIHKRFKDEHITIPYPQRVVSLNQK